MKKAVLSLILTNFLVVSLSFAQTTASSAAPDRAPSGAEKLSEPAVRTGLAPDDDVKNSFPKIAHPLPFKAGENLQYEVSFEKLIFSGVIGDLLLSVSKSETPKSEVKKAELLALKAEIVSKGFFPTLFGIKVKDEYNAVVHRDDLGLFGASRLLQEGKAVTEHKTYVDRQEKRVKYVFRDLVNTAAEPKVKETESPAWVQDILSAIYFVRTQELKEGNVIPIPITDAGQNYNIEVIVGKPEEVKVDAGKFRAFKVETKAFNGKLVRKSGELFLWISDDARRLPVKARIKVSGTTVNVELKKAKA